MNVPVCSYDVLIFHETWLNSNFYDGELNLLQYNIYRKDRSSDTSVCERGRGVLIAVRKSIASRILETPGNIEQLFVVLGSGNSSLILEAVYLPPRSRATAYTTFCDTLDTLFKKFPSSNFHVLGDFNLLNSTWETAPLSSTITAAHGTPLEEVPSVHEL